jgi:polyphosphate kinase
MSEFSFTREHLINRDLSWLDFNGRVLEEASDKNIPPLDRLKFIAIFSNNLDEFFMVRVAGLRQQFDAKDKGTDASGLSVSEQLDEIRKKIHGLVTEQYRLLNTEILPSLNNNGLTILRKEDYGAEERDELAKIFKKMIYPTLTPMAVDPSHPFPVINNCAIEIAVRLKQQNSKKTARALVEVPSVLPRFIAVSSKKKPGTKTYALLEDVITEFVGELFADCEILESIPFRITKDMDFAIDEEGVDDLLSHIRKELLQTRTRQALRLEFMKERRGSLETWLMDRLGVDQNSKYVVDGPLHLANFFELVSKESGKKLEEEEWTPAENNDFQSEESVFKIIREKEAISLFLPFQSFEPVVRLLNEAAEDPNVLAIKQTLYRVSGNSPVVAALEKAAENGKQVTVIVELKARFDEGNNIVWAKKLEESGAHVIYGMPGLKIHCKALMIIRKEESGIRRYLHLSTGNYNDKTARIYTDIGYFTTDQEMCSDISALFNVMTGYSSPPSSWRKIAAAPFDLKEKFISLIDREARLSTPHRPGRIIAKMNSLVEPSIIEHIYKAAHAGAKIDLIVRGICCLKPGIGTNNITVRSIVDRYLEHSRIYYFENGGEPEYYLSSADWMPRNLYKRIEVLFPVEDAKTRKILDEILRIQLHDKRKTRELHPSGKYSACDKSGAGDSTRSQKISYDFFKAVIPKEKVLIS